MVGAEFGKTGIFGVNVGGGEGRYFLNLGKLHDYLDYNLLEPNDLLIYYNRLSIY